MRRTFQTMDNALVQRCQSAKTKNEKIELIDEGRKVAGYVEAIEQAAPDLIEITLEKRGLRIVPDVSDPHARAISVFARCVRAASTRAAPGK